MQIIILKVFHLFLYQWHDIGIIWNNLNPNTQKDHDKYINKFLSYLSDYLHTKIVWQTETNPCVTSIIPNSLAGLVQKMFMAKIKLFSVTYVNFGFI